MDLGRVAGICPRCGAAVDGRSRTCPSCGAEISSQSQMPTVRAPDASPKGPPSPSGRAGGLDTPRSSPRVAFTPGEVLAGRYRIIALLGRGGMGEVYRADDLELGQPVSLKFLPSSLAQSPGALERFRAEVRNARQVSHPNVCRVYDIGEYQGLHFLTMEFVDGEDLATLLRRIGKLPAAKANEVAGQLCAGLAAAHDKDVLHRDLKPSNVMIDGEGHVRITDFGLAVRPGEGEGDLAGTPAYMAPEQFAGAPVTVRSDLYSLGLILYEIFTGRRPFEATSIAEWKSRHTQTTPTLPSAREPDLDQAVERAILRCLEKDPTKRPASARQLAAALPGGDPLAAALAAGETPSPEMVAASGGEGALAPRTAWTLAAGLLLGLVAMVVLSPFASDLGLARMTNGSAALRDRASQFLDRLGYGRDALDRESWMAREYAPMLYVARHTPSTRWRANWRAVGAPVQLVYRQSPRWMASSDPSGELGPTDPPLEFSDMAVMAVSAGGNLRYLRAVPPQIDSAGTRRAPDWPALFEAAGFDTARFRAVPPSWVPPEAYDARAEWVGTIAAFPEVPLRVAAAAYKGRAVYFEIFGPWSRPERMERPTLSLTQRIAGGTAAAVTTVSMLAALFLTRRNLRLGRGDSKGALRIAGFLLVMSLARWLTDAHHVPSLQLESRSLLLACGGGLLLAIFSAALYVAVEPYVRRRMPELMVGWSRLLEGRFRDPRVGRDVLTGALLGLASTLLIDLSNALPTWIPILGQTTVPPAAAMIAGGGRAVGAVVLFAMNSVVAALAVFLVVFLVRIALRKEWAVLIAMMILFSLGGLGGENVALETPFAVLQGVILGWTFARVGLLGAMAMLLFRQVLSAVALPIDSSTPYSLTTILVLGLMVLIAGYAFRISIGSRPLFSASALDD